MNRRCWAALAATIGVAATAVALCTLDPNATLPDLAYGAARHWKLCGLAIGLGAGAMWYAPVAPGAAVLALALSQVVSHFC